MVLHTEQRAIWPQHKSACKVPIPPLRAEGTLLESSNPPNPRHTSMHAALHAPFPMSHVVPRSRNPQTLLTLPRLDEWSSAAGAKPAYHRTLRFAGKVRNDSGRRPSYRFDGGVSDIGHEDGREMAGTACPPAYSRVRVGPRDTGRREKSGRGSDASRDGEASRRSRRFHGADDLVVVLSFEPTMIVTNLLTTTADVRLEGPSRRGAGLGASVADQSATQWSRTIERGAGIACMNCAPHEEVRWQVSFGCGKTRDVSSALGPRCGLCVKKIIAAAGWAFQMVSISWN